METCSQCNSDVSEEAKICPKCGHPQYKHGILYALSVGSIVTAIIMVLLFRMFQIDYSFLSGMIIFTIYMAIFNSTNRN